MKASKWTVQEYWDAQPCGSFEPPGKLPPPAYFRAHERIRYEREPEIAAFADFEHWRRRQVLEIGVGIGADFVRFGKAGANAVGLDLSIRSLALARQNAEINHVLPALLEADAEALPFADHTFDLVYSWGVLHHTPDTERAIREVHRVLKPGSECRVMLYHRRSLLALQCYLRYGLGMLRPFAPLSELIATHIESPGTKAFTYPEARTLFRSFLQVEIRPVATVYDLRLGRRRFAPRWMLGMVPNQLGWFLLIRAVK
jgi:ubiquinone/menaquinone biosynthesis C-methylase UbiE